MVWLNVKSDWPLWYASSQFQNACLHLDCPQPKMAHTRSLFNYLYNFKKCNNSGNHVIKSVKYRDSGKEDIQYADESQFAGFAQIKTCF